jgi:photosystem II stability/assembly factor-like uncharacterized protein
MLLSVSASVAIATWTSLGPASGPIYSAAASADSAPTIYVAPCYFPMHIAKSTDGGATWGWTAGSFGSYVTELTVDPSNRDMLYCINNAQVHKTTDGGESWSVLPTPSGHSITDVDLNPHHPAVVYVAATCSTRTRLARSTDGGATWQSFTCDTTSGLSAARVAADPVDTNIVYCAAQASDQKTYVFRSTDRGETWTGASTGNGFVVFGLRVSAANHNIVFLATYYLGIQRSTDGGATWARTFTLSDYVYCLAETRQSPGVIYASTSVGVYRSADTGRTWVPAATDVGHNVYAVFADPGNDSTVYSGSLAGMYKSSDQGANWQILMTDFPFHQIKAIGVAPTDGNMVYAESEGNAIYRSIDAGTTWTRSPFFLSCGQICGFLVDPLDPQTAWAQEGSG